MKTLRSHSKDCSEPVREWREPKAKEVEDSYHQELVKAHIGRIERMCQEDERGLFS